MDNLYQHEQHITHIFSCLQAQDDPATSDQTSNAAASAGPATAATTSSQSPDVPPHAHGLSNGSSKDQSEVVAGSKDHQEADAGDGWGGQEDLGSLMMQEAVAAPAAAAGATAHHADTTSWDHAAQEPADNGHAVAQQLQQLQLHAAGSAVASPMAVAGAAPLGLGFDTIQQQQLQPAAQSDIPHGVASSAVGFDVAAAGATAAPAAATAEQGGLQGTSGFDAAGVQHQPEPEQQLAYAAQQEAAASAQHAEPNAATCSATVPAVAEDVASEIATPTHTVATSSQGGASPSAAATAANASIATSSSSLAGGNEHDADAVVPRAAYDKLKQKLETAKVQFFEMKDVHHKTRDANRKMKEQVLKHREQVRV